MGRNYDGSYAAGKPFGIKVHLAGEPGRQDAGTDDWVISLPHQCDSWIITASPDRDTALTEARWFRDELDAAIRRVESA